MTAPQPLIQSCDALVIGGGPAGLMACQALLEGGRKVILVEAKPSLGRKFLMAGKSGLNLSKMEPLERFLSAYGASQAALTPMVRAFDPEAVQAWAEDLGQTCFTGSTGRLFPKAMKASPLLRAWLARLDRPDFTLRLRWRWSAWADGCFGFDTPDGPQTLRPKVVVLACGGASWPRLGSDGAWFDLLRSRQIPLAPLEPANAALQIAWSPFMAPHFGKPLKALSFRAGALRSRGEATLSEQGIEGGGIYPLSPALRQGAPLLLDLAPDLDLAALSLRLSRPRGKQSLSNHLRKTLRLAPQISALLNEVDRNLPAQPEALATRLKSLPVPYQGLAPLEHAISTAGGLQWSALDEALMLKTHPGVFGAGEMLDWEAPTGGYLLTACLATGLWAGKNAALFKSDAG